MTLLLEQIGLASQWGAVTDAGRVRSDNQDACCANDEIGLFVVSDGMGGHRGGAMAANMVVDDLPIFIEAGLYRLKSHSPRSIRRMIRQSIRKQNRQVMLEGMLGDGHEDMGATVALLLIHQERIYACNLGDSRIYRYRNGRLTQISQDHSYIREMTEQGVHPDELKGCEGLITQHIGMMDKARPHLRSFLPKPGDKYLLCSDGLTDMVSANEIRQMLGRQLPPPLICEQLVDLANQYGGPDNITSLLIEYPLL